MSVVRVVLAVAVAAALVGLGASAAESAERERDADLAAAELERLATAADRLAAGSDPVGPDRDGAATTLRVRVPSATFGGGGRVALDDDRLAWYPATGQPRTVRADVAIETPERLVLNPGSHRLRLSVHCHLGGDRVLIERAGARAVSGSSEHRSRLTGPPRSVTER